MCHVQKVSHVVCSEVMKVLLVRCDDGPGQLQGLVAGPQISPRGYTWVKNQVKPGPGVTPHIQESSGQDT